jgi:hypothetical protein
VKRGIGNFLPPPRFWIHALSLIPAFTAMTVVPTPLLSYSQRRLPARLSCLRRAVYISDQFALVNATFQRRSVSWPRTQIRQPST